MSERTLLVNANESKLHEDIQPSSKRWFLALLLIINVFIICFTTYFFVEVKKVFVRYFQLPHVAIEWFIITQQPGIVVGFIGIGLFDYRDNYGFRLLSIASSSISIVSNVLLQLSVTFSKAYILTFISQFLNGICHALSKVMAAQLAKRWFPKNQVGIALSFFTVACASARTLTYTLPSHVLNVIYDGDNSTIIDYINVTNKNITWHNTIKTRLYYFYGPLIAFLVVTWILFIVYSENLPIKPPTESETQGKKKDFFEHVKEFYKEFKVIMSDKIVLQVTMLETIRSSVSITQGIFMGEILRKLITGSSGHYVANMATTSVLVIYEVSLLIGCVFSGLLLDYYKKHVVEATTAMIMFFVFNIGITLAYIFKGLYLMYVFNSLAGFSSGLAVVCVFDLVLCHLHLKDPGFVSLSIGIAKFIGLAIIFQITRIILITGGGLCVFIFQSVLLVFAVVNCALIRLKHNYRGQT